MPTQPDPPEYNPETDCPIEAVFYPDRIPCQFARGHAGPHSFVTHVLTEDGLQEVSGGPRT